jgi:hypothetical protein
MTMTGEDQGRHHIERSRCPRSYCRIVDVVFDDVRVYPEEPLPTGVVVVKVKLRNTRDGLWVDRAENVAREGGEWRIMKF